MDLKNKLWRNDIKDFLYNQIEDNDYNEVVITFKIMGSDDTLKIKTTRPDLIFGVTYILMPEKDKSLYNGLIIINPLSNEELPIYFANVEEVHMGIPAHNDEDYTFALENKIAIKQVIMPVNTSMNENAPRDDKEWTFRDTVVLVVKHYAEEKYLYISYNNHDWKCLITGGIEPGETSEESAIRELREESGYQNIKIIKKLPFIMANVFYAAHKGVNRYVTAQGFYMELENGLQSQLDEEEAKEHTINWETKDNLIKILENGFTDCVWLLKQSLNEIKAYTGNGKYINSIILNNIEDRKEALKKIMAEL